VYPTDQYHADRFKELAAEVNDRNAKKRSKARVNVERYTQATPETIHEAFAPRFFHLVISNLGGLMYTPLDPAKGVASVMRTVKPHEELFVVSHDAEDLGGRAVQLTHMGTPTSVGRYVKANPHIHAAEQVVITAWDSYNRLLLRKKMPIQIDEPIWTKSFQPIARTTVWSEGKETTQKR